MLPLTFADKADYDTLQTGDKVSIVGLEKFAPGVPLTMVVKKSDGSTQDITLNHTFNAEQIEWFRAGSKCFFAPFFPSFFFFGEVL